MDDRTYHNIVDNILLKSGAVLLTGAKDELGCDLITFQSSQQSLFIQLDYCTLVQTLCSIMTYYDSPVIALLVNFHLSSPQFIEHVAEVINQIEKKLLKAKIKRVYMVKPEKKSSQKSFAREFRSKETRRRFTAEVIIVKNVDELYQYIRTKSLTPDFGGVLVHDYTAWANVQKMLISYYVLVERTAQIVPSVSEKVHSLVSGQDRSMLAKGENQHSLRKYLYEAEKKKSKLIKQRSTTNYTSDRRSLPTLHHLFEDFMQCNLIDALKEGHKLRSYFQDPSLNDDFHALSKTPLLEWDKAKFHEFYRKALNLKNVVENSWKDGLSHSQLISKEQRLYESLSLCCSWIVDHGLPYLTKVPAQCSTLSAALTQRKTFENEFYQQANEMLNKSRHTLKEIHTWQRSRDTSASFQSLADNLLCLTAKLKEKLDERMKFLRKQCAFMDALRKAETWYEKAKGFWPSRREPSPHHGNACLSPSSLTDVTRSEYELELFLERYPPLTRKDLGLLLEHLDDVNDMELRNRARLLGNRCQEMEKILRARETHLIDTSGEQWMFEEESSEPTNTRRMTGNIDSLGSRNRSFETQLALHYGRGLSLDNHHSLSSTVPGRHYRSSTVSNYAFYPRKEKRRTRNREGNFLSSTTVSNNESISLKSGMDTSFSGSAAEHFNELGSESRLQDIQRRLRDQELLYEQLIIEQELREIDENAEEKRSELTDSLNVSSDRLASVTICDRTRHPSVPVTNTVNKLGTSKLPDDHSMADNILSTKAAYNTTSNKPRSDTRKGGTSKSTSDTNYHSNPNSPLSGAQLVRRPGSVGQPASSSRQMMFPKTFTLPDHDTQDKLKIARQAEQHWIRVKNEQRVRLGHVIYDITKRKEIEEMYFSAQLQLCRVRREIAILDKSRSCSSRLLRNNVSSPATMSCTNNLKLSKIYYQDLSKRHGAFQPYVKDDVTEYGNVISSNPAQTIKSEEESTGIVEEKESLDILGMTRDEKDLERGPGHHLHPGDCEKLPLENMGLVQVERISQRERTGCEIQVEDDEEETSDEFEDGEEEELMILRSDSSCDQRSQDELKDSLREEQERLEEMFRHQKEFFKKEQQKLKEEEEKIEEWQTKKVSPEGKKMPDGKLREIDKQAAVEDWKRKPSVNESIMNKSEEMHKRDDHRQELKQHHKKQQQHGVVSCAVPDDPNYRSDVSELDQIFVTNGDLEDETREEIEEELIKILKEGKSTDEEETENDQTDTKEYIEQREAMVTNLITPTFEKSKPLDNVLQLKELEDADDIEMMNQVIDDLILNDQYVEDQNVDTEVNFDHYGEDVDKQDSQGYCTPADDDNSSVDLDIRLDIGDERKNDYGKDVDKQDSQGCCTPADDDNSSVDLDIRLDIGDERKNDYGKDVDKQDSQGCRTPADDDSASVDLDIRLDIGDERKNDYGKDVDKQDSQGFCAPADDDNSSVDLDIRLDIGDERKNVEDSDILLLRELDKNLSNVAGHDVSMRIPGEEKDNDSRVGHTPIGNVTDRVKEIQGNHRIEKDTPSSHSSIQLDARLEKDREDTAGLNELHEFIWDPSRAHEGKRNAEALLNIDTSYKNNNTSELSGTTWDKREPEDGLSIDVDFNIDLTEGRSTLDDGLSLMELMKAKDQATESEGSLEDDEVVIGIHELEEDTVLNGTQSEADSNVRDEHTGDNQGNSDIPEDNQNGVIHVFSKYDPKHFRNSCAVTEHREEPLTVALDHEDLGGMEVNSNREDNIEDADMIVRNDREIHETREDNEGYYQEQFSKSDVETDEDSDSEYGRVLEDIEEEGSEYDEHVDNESTHVDNNDELEKDHTEVHSVPSISVLRSASFTGRVNQVTGPSFSSSIIIDPGSGFCKAGFSIDDRPRVCIPSVVGIPRPQEGTFGRYKEHYVGYDATKLHQVLTLRHPLKNGVVEDWDLMEKLLDKIYEELRCESDQYPVLLSEPPLNPKTNREEIIQMMFETFHVPATYICVQAVLALFATGRTTGLVYDCGHGVTHSVPIYEGYALPHTTRCPDLAGRELTLWLGRMLRDRGVSLQTSAELEIVQDIKEKLCYVVVDYDTERRAYNTGERLDTTYTMPDGQTITIGSERFRCPEVLFAPSIMGMATDGIHEVIYKTASQCAVDIRSTLLKNIVLSGGSTMFPGLPRRLHLELSQLLGTSSPDRVHIEAGEERTFLAWQGGSMLSKLSNFASMWITAQEYEEFGPEVVHKKCV